MRAATSLGPILAAGLMMAALLAWCGPIDRAARAQGGAEPNVAWEYRQETSTPATDSELLDEEVLKDQQQMLAANGRDGWELASTHTFPMTGEQGAGQGAYGVVYVFKRPMR